MPSLVGSEMCIRDRYQRRVHGEKDFYALKTVPMAKEEALSLGMMNSLEEPKRTEGEAELVLKVLVGSFVNNDEVINLKKERERAFQPIVIGSDKKCDYVVYDELFCPKEACFIGYSPNCGWYVSDEREMLMHSTTKRTVTTADAKDENLVINPEEKKISMATAPGVKIFLSNNYFGDIKQKYKLTITLEDGMLIEVGKAMGFSWVFKAEIKPRLMLSSGPPGFWFENKDWLASEEA
eukprot:TRINITY_DN2691_c0_g1_i7.p2 TRINITY_DN2691_c0_g1~~TRINITY_DN2691_c0_g1_i7.p2  ORF type:complete len:237 (-),score=80.83 TRINITY_DN2691_c0_g1_i7:238-948(-)